MANNARTIEDLERKYDFSKLLGLTKNVKVLEKSLINVQNELSKTLNTLIINLKDFMNDQSEVSLWFYSGIPTLENEPYINFDDVNEHYGDLYYDKETGYVYQFKESGWEKNEDLDLIQAMALSNTELDTEDNERKIYFTQPQPPYSNGDWWILNDGSLKICQIAKTEGNYDVNDFIISSKYVATVSTKVAEVTTVLKGTVQEITENYVKFTDLSTGGSTIIDGSNIKTGTISTDDITIGNDNVQIDTDGIKLKNGSKVLGENGLLNTYIYGSNISSNCGYLIDPFLSGIKEVQTVKISVVIPAGLKIVNAYVQLVHSPIKWGYTESATEHGTVWGYSRNLKLYKNSNLFNSIKSADMGSEIRTEEEPAYEEVSAFGSSGWTASLASDTKHTTEQYKSGNIIDAFDENNVYEFYIKPSVDIDSSWTAKDGCSRTGSIYAIIVINGYMSYNWKAVETLLTESNEELLTEDGEELLTEGGYYE